MATQRLYLVFDNSTFANYFAWASPISAWFASSGWTQKPDTGQVMWSGMNLTQVAMSGSNATYTFNSLTGLALVAGRALTITGMTNGGNNGTFTVTSVSGTTSGTFVVVNGSGVNESGSTGVVTAASAAPGVGASGFEIWQPGDALQTGGTVYYLRIDYGNTASNSNSPWIRATISNATNGAGTLTGSTVGPITNSPSSPAAGSGASISECLFYGDSGSIGFAMWRNGIAAAPHLIAVERTLDSTGAPNSDGVTLVHLQVSNTTLITNTFQRTYVFGIGPANLASFPVTIFNSTLAASQSFGTGISMSSVYPDYGKFGNGMLLLGACQGVDAADGAILSITVYGSAHTFIAIKSSTAFTRMNSGNTTNSAVLLRWE